MLSVRSVVHYEQRKPRALHVVRKGAMLYKAYMSRRSDLEAECIFPLSDRVSFATRSGPTARRSSNFGFVR